MKFLILLVILISNIILFKNITKNKFLILIETSIILYFLIDRKKLLLLWSKIYYTKSNIIDLQNYNSLDDFIKKHLSSKRRNDIRKDIKILDKMKVTESGICLYHFNYLHNFLSKKFKSPSIVNFNFLLSLFVIATFKLNYLNFYDSNNKLLGWSSYFIDDGVYYDFLSSPNEIYISHILTNSLKYCFNNKITKIDIGPTHDDIKRRKLNSNEYNINVSLLDLFT